MEIFIDEGGQFTRTTGWSVVCGLALPDKEVGKVRRKLAHLTKHWPKAPNGELKGGALATNHLAASSARDCHRRGGGNTTGRSGPVVDKDWLHGSSNVMACRVFSARAGMNRMSPQCETFDVATLSDHRHRSRAVLVGKGEFSLTDNSIGSNITLLANILR